MAVNSAPARRNDRDQSRLDRDTLIHATVDLVDRHGVERFTMRMLAEVLGRSTMATYRHVANKEELITLAAEAVLVDVQIPDPASGTTRARLRMLGRSAFDQLASHPWVAPYLLTARQQPTPHAALLLDAITTTVCEVEPDPTRARYAAAAIRAYLIGWLAGSPAHDRTPSARDTLHSALSKTAQAQFDYGLDALITGILASVS